MPKKQSNKMVCVITGDLINSQSTAADQWLKTLKRALNHYGKQPQQWEIFRGDSFQLETEAENGLKAAIYIKTCMKQQKPLDARMAMGIGEKTHDAESITEANGSAFVNSGTCFEDLRNDHLGIRSPWPEIDLKFKVILNLLSFIMSSWTNNQLELVKLAFEFPEATQAELAKKLGTHQSNVSRDLKVTGYYDFLKTIKTYEYTIEQMT